MNRIFTNFKKQCMRAVLLTFAAFSMQQAQAQVGAWSALHNQSPQGSGGLMLLLTDGTVMAKSSSGLTNGNVWMKLTPDASGSYVNGTWSTLAPMINDRLYFSSQVLQDGRVYVAGGEYGAGGDQAEVYNPLTNQWTAITNTGGRISDGNSEMLPDGRVLQSMVNGTLRGSQIFDPSTNSYVTGPTSNGNPNESAWVKLPDNSILMVNIGTRNSERYIPSLGVWVTDATVPVDLYDPYGSESGTAFMLPDGRAFFTGSPSTTAYYTPSGNNNPGTWAAGPALPNSQGQPDAPGAMMNNGKILLAVDPTPQNNNVFIAPTTFYEFNYLTNTFTSINGPSGGASENYPTYVANMLSLPDGSVMYVNQGATQYYVYKPSGTQLTIGKPAITQVTANDCSGSSYNITGTKFNGISEGSCYGDDWQMSTNYPVIRLTNGTNVYYARTTKWNYSNVATFTLPAGLPAATYSLVVTCNGFSSDAVQFTPSTCTGPVVNITSPANNATYIAPASIAITATATTPTGTITKVDFYNGATLLGTSTTSPYTYNWTNPANGTYSITAKATNSASVSTTSSAVTVVVKSNTAPTVTLTSPTNGASYTAPATVTLTATAADADGTVAKVEFYNGTTLITTKTASPYTYSWTPVAAGTYNITAKAYDNLSAVTISGISTITVIAAGSCPDPQYIAGTTYATGAKVQNNGHEYQCTVGGWCSSSSATYYAPGTGSAWTSAWNDLGACGGGTNAAPTVSITAPANNATFTAPATINITANAADTDGSVSKVDFYNGTTLLGTDVTAPYSYSWTNVAAGNYNITAKATDNQNASTTSSIVTITVSGTANTPPAVSLTSPANNASFAAPATITLAATATDADGTVSKVEFYYNNGTTLIGTKTTSPYTYSWTGVTAGNYSITAKAYDNLNASTVSNAASIIVSGGSSCTAQAWDVNQTYSTGGLYVQYNGIKYISNYWTKGDQPDLHNGGSGSGQPWTSQGTCTSRVGEAEAISIIAVYPNPSSGEFTIEVPENTTASIINTFGNEIANLDLTAGKNDVDLKLSAGIYFVKFKTGIIKLVIN